MSCSVTSLCLQDNYLWSIFCWYKHPPKAALPPSRCHTSLVIQLSLQLPRPFQVPKRGLSGYTPSQYHRFSPASRTAVLGGTSIPCFSVTPRNVFQCWPRSCSIGRLRLQTESLRDNYLWPVLNEICSMKQMFWRFVCFTDMIYILCFQLLLSIYHHSI